MMKHLALISFSVILAVLSGTTVSCKKRKFNSTGNLEFSKDTVVFDTVFTTIGSTTQQLKVYNRDNRGLVIEEIQLMGGANSPYRINFDGVSGISFTNIEINGKDSMFCFVEVTLDPNNGTLPLIVEDSVRFRTNGKDQYVKLAAWGQDAYFHYKDILPASETVWNWANDKPHVIYNYAAIGEGQTLNIPAGTQVYLHKLSFLYVDRGTLNIEGTLTEKVKFRGDRLESFYDDVSGQYYGIYLDSATNCSIKHLDLRNAITGIHVESRNPAAGPTLTIENSEIGNCASYGMLLFDRAQVVAKNTLIHSNGIHALVVLQGADFIFTHCDLLGYGDGEGTTPAVGISNALTQNGVQTVGSIPHGYFRNCLIYGSDENQVAFDTIVAGGVTINIALKNCRVRSEVNTTAGIYEDCYFTGNPAFTNISEKKFTRLASSSLQGQGDASFVSSDAVLLTDLGGNPRTPPVVDIGAYEAP